MKEHEFITHIRNEVIKSNLQTYRALFVETELQDGSDPYWQAALRFFQMLDDAQRCALFSIIKQVMVDTVSNVLGILDGVSGLEDQQSSFELLMDGRNIAGSLQDQFLAEEEEDAQ